MDSKPVLTRTAKIWLGEDGLIHLVYVPNAWDTLADAEENLRVIANLQPPQRRPWLIDIRSIHGIDREARTYYSGAAAAAFAPAVALVVESPVTQIMANFFIGFNQPPVPTRLFTSEEAARAWLKGFME